ncbi:hypothetical protein AB2J22_21280 [Aeromonas sp. A5]|uniref:EcpB family pilus assembly chaperone n=1 Tax=unclassified Aeromonas TaxID=257493 RepID=UPI00376F99DE
MRTLLLLISIFLSFNVFAINVGPISIFMSPERNEVSREIKNETEQARLVTVSVSRISSPEEGGRRVNADLDGELLLSPSRLILPGNSKNNVRFFYNGIVDDKERYYRITWTETGLSLQHESTESRQAVATTSAVISTILVVSPRKSKLDYAFDNGVLINKGNSSYRVVAYGICSDDPTKKCKEVYYDMPGKNRTFKKVNVSNQKGHIGIWFAGRFIIVK